MTKTNDDSFIVTAVKFVLMCFFWALWAFLSTITVGWMLNDFHLSWHKIIDINFAIWVGAFFYTLYDGTAKAIRES